jgi:hypothetical protein
MRGPGTLTTRTLPAAGAQPPIKPSKPRTRPPPRRRRKTPPARSLPRPAASAACNDASKLCGAAGCGALLVTKKYVKIRGGKNTTCCLGGHVYVGEWVARARPLGKGFLPEGFRSFRTPQGSTLNQPRRFRASTARD